MIGPEEHIALPVALEAWACAGVPHLGRSGFGDGPFALRVRDFTDQCLAMDNRGADVAVLALNSPGVQNLPAANAAAETTHSG
ncbi:hypothetical protein SAMN00790413_06107 [Deinococcus hopiensis KR-140]|uniref:Uncharacterized protein n=1 Tax=Deinococcus hopiensis KR-140 TaxID=695939 RepID=A0A1W1VX17_9DEIO|nr:hypothetical protein SAMN00790413_06107 [Deinococcus hopiensis KR-140]